MFVRHHLQGCCSSLAVSSLESICCSPRHGWFIITWLTVLYSKGTLKKWPLIPFISTQLFGRLYPVAVPELIQAGNYQQPPMPHDMGLQFDPLPGLESPYLKMAPVGLCFWTPCCLMLWKESLVPLPEFQPISSV